MTRALFLIASLLVASAAAAQQYKWTDNKGRVQYGDVPPPGVRPIPMRSYTPPASPAPEAAAKKDDAKAAKKGPLTPAEQEAEFRARQQDAEKARQKQAQADQAAEGKRENCSRAQEMARSLEGGRVSRTDSKGERYYLEDNQVAAEKAKAQQAIREWCN